MRIGIFGRGRLAAHGLAGDDFLETVHHHQVAGRKA